MTPLKKSHERPKLKDIAVCIYSADREVFDCHAVGINYQMSPKSADGYVAYPPDVNARIIQSCAPEQE